MSLLQGLAGHRLMLPDDITSMGCIDHAAECDPRDAGMTERGVDAIWSSMQQLYATGLHPSITLVLRRRGQLVMKRAIGTADPEQPSRQPTLDTDAPQCIFSASKVVTALLVHKLVENGRLRLEDPIAQYIPEFGQHGKQNITLRDLLAHRAGVPFIPREHADPALLLDWERIIRIICETPPHFPNPATQAYHALTSGYIAGEVVRRAGDIELKEALHDWIARPLGCRYLTFGADPSIRHQIAQNAVTGPNPPWPMSSYLKRILGVPFREAIAAAGEDAFLSAVVPAGNIHASANDLGRMFEMLRRGGELDGTRILKTRTVREAIRPVSRIRHDRTLYFPIRYSAGFMLGQNPAGLYGPRCGQAYGHLGFVNILGWADPARATSIALLNTGKSISPTGALRLFQLLWTIAGACKR